jgi:hypothetical protein
MSHGVDSQVRARLLVSSLCIYYFCFIFLLYFSFMFGLGAPTYLFNKILVGLKKITQSSRPLSQSLKVRILLRLVS